MTLITDRTLDVDFKIWMKLVDAEEFRAVGVEIQDRESAKILWTTASGLLCTSFIQILTRSTFLSVILINLKNRHFPIYPKTYELIETES